MNDETNTPIVLGSELAAAQAHERERRAAHPEPSLLAELRYAGRRVSADAPSFRKEQLDDTLRDLGIEWLHLPAIVLHELHDLLSLDDLYTLLTFVHRSTVLGLRSRDPQWPRAALAILTLVTPDRVDHRDLTWAAGLVAYTLNQLTPSGADEIRRAANRADPSTRPLLERLAETPPRTLTDWGYGIIGQGDDLSVVRHEHQPWNPTVDLAQIAHRVAAAIDAEASYVATSITIATRVPLVWLKGSPKEPEARQALDQSLATASVHAEPLANDHATDHIFMAFITEFASPRAAELTARSSAAATGSFARLGIANGAVAVVLIARSVVQGVPNLEHDQTLQRFRQPLTEAIAR